MGRALPLTAVFAFDLAVIRRAYALASLAVALFATASPRANAQSPSPAPTLSPEPSPTVEPAVPDQYVHGQLLTIGNGFIVFTTGDALRLRAGTPVPKGATVGSLVRVTIDQLARDVKAVELEPRTTLPGETDATSLGKEYIVRSAGSAPKPSATDTAPPPPSELVTVTLFVEVPSNTPVGDDVYLSTERSGYNASEIRMNQVDARHFTTALSLPSGSRLRYQYTRGYNTTVERARNGDIAQPHEFTARANMRETDTVERWADVN
jgi:hypothetical protein